MYHEGGEVRSQVDGLVDLGDLDSLLKAALLLESPATIEAGPHHERLTTIALALEEALLDDASVSLDVSSPADCRRTVSSFSATP
jgi:hypothetical protein